MAGEVALPVSEATRVPHREDYVVDSGTGSILQEFPTMAFKNLRLTPIDVITHDESLFRPSDIEIILLNPGKMTRDLAWSARYGLDSIVDALLSGDVGPTLPGTSAH